MTTALTHRPPPLDTEDADPGWDLHAAAEHPPTAARRLPSPDHDPAPYVCLWRHPRVRPRAGLVRSENFSPRAKPQRGDAASFWRVYFTGYATFPLLCLLLIATIPLFPGRVP